MTVACRSCQGIRSTVERIEVHAHPDGLREELEEAELDRQRQRYEELARRERARIRSGEADTTSQPIVI